MVLLPGAQAAAQYPPPTPTPTSTPTTGATLECTIEARPASLIVTCTGTGFAPGSQVLVQLYAVGLDDGSAMGLAAGILAAPFPGEELVQTLTATADADGDITATIIVPGCDLTALRVVATGVSAGGAALEAEDAIDDPGLLACASGVGGEGDLATTGFDWLKWFALGLVLVTVGAWIANVRDERTHSLIA
jgi:hypothetical protein